MANGVCLWRETGAGASGGRFLRRDHHRREDAGIDGPMLLREVQKLYPETIRIVLSGQSSRRALFEFIGICHQYLSKPCDAADLKAKISNALRLCDVLGNPAVKSAISGMCCVPSVPALYQEITKELENPDPSLARVAEIISKDA